eukprot:TRINITY_DN10201_c0_g1_i1.p1 TRINITY_DN10201_c0_g1~~TRINITY_DN10201_c0_g1_i1.p1  ORF type:complete len:164 (+),score=18.79 TRINITY_DN10201_c0_g1_i1:29-520(+)
MPMTLGEVEALERNGGVYSAAQQRASKPTGSRRRATSKSTSHNRKKPARSGSVPPRELPTLLEVQNLEKRQAFGPQSVRQPPQMSQWVGPFGMVRNDAVPTQFVVQQTPYTQQTAQPMYYIAAPPTTATPMTSAVQFVPAYGTQSNVVAYWPHTGTGPLPSSY